MPSIWAPEPKRIIPPGLRRPIFPGERGWDEAWRLYGLINTGLVNDGHAMVNAGVIRAHTTGVAAPPVAGYVIWLNSQLGTFSDEAGTTPVTADGSAVRNWKDQSGNAHNVSSADAATLKTNILNGKPAIRFAATSILKAGAFTLNQPETVFIVAILPSLQNGFFCDGNSATAMGFRDQNSSSQLQMFGFSLGPTASEPSTGVGVIYCGEWNGASSQLRVNAGSTNTGNVGSANAGGFTLGGRADNTNRLSMDCCEVIVYASALNTTDETSVRNYLNTRYACF